MDALVSGGLSGPATTAPTSVPDGPRHLRRESARVLRGQGLTYLEIAQLLAVPKPTVAYWTRDIPAPERGNRQRTWAEEQEVRKVIAEFTGEHGEPGPLPDPAPRRSRRRIPKPGEEGFAALQAKAIALREQGWSRRRIRDELGISNNDLLNAVIAGEVPPKWENRPNAKDDLRARARELRLEGWTYDQIELELGVSKSSISLWVRDLPKPERRQEHIDQVRFAARERWDAELALREEGRQVVKSEARAEVGGLSQRELMLVGTALYWAEGSKDKSYRRSERLCFINSDPDMIRVYLAWLDLLGVESERRRYTVAIHETADVAGAERFWADFVGVSVEALLKTTIKKHNPKTVRMNTGDEYRGCLKVTVLDSAELYRRMDGCWQGMVEGVSAVAGEL